MISVEAARSEVRKRCAPKPGRVTAPLRSAVGRVLAAPVLADRDDPPFSKATMDGFAVRAEDLGRSLPIVGAISAGDSEIPPLRPGTALRINTGAPLPEGADAVVPLERAEERGGELTVETPCGAGTNVLFRGSLARAGDRIVEGRLTPEKLALCASAGAREVACLPPVRVAVLATGSELAGEPGAHEIRNGNGPMVAALLAGPCTEVEDLGVAPDDPELLAALLSRGLSSDVLVTTGGVSKGSKDLVRDALERLGTQIVFHGVALQPGKPLLFGLRGEVAVFSLPGNPVAALVCCDLFASPFVAARAGLGFGFPLLETSGRLRGPVRGKRERARVLPCIRHGDGGLEPLAWRGSADLQTASRGNAYVVVPSGPGLEEGESAACFVPRRHAFPQVPAA